VLPRVQFVYKCCPDQSSYELALTASLLDGNRRAGEAAHRPGR